MNKTEFLEYARKKYKEQLEVKNEFVPEMDFIYSPHLVLRVWFDVKTSEYMHRWCSTETLQTTDGLRLNEKEHIVHNQDIQTRILNDITEMDMDTFAALIEYLYPVKAEIQDDDESIKIIVDESKGFTTLNEIF